MHIVKDVRINREIRAREVRVIDSEGKQLGILPLVEALRQAATVELDLVEVSSKIRSAGLPNHGLWEVQIPAE